MKVAAKAVAASLCGVLLLAFTLGPRVGAAAAATNPCDHPDALLQAGEYTSAYAAYALVEPTDSRCARQGMAAAGALQAASQLISVGLVTDANAEIVRAVDEDPVLTLPTSLLTKTGATRAVALAETLEMDGFHQQAVQILLFLTEAHTRISLNPAAQYILTPPGEPVWDSIGHGIVNYALTWEGFVLVTVVLVMVLTYYPLTRRRLHVQPFTMTSADAGADAEHLRGLVRDELQRLAVEHARTDKGDRLRIDIAGPYDEPLDIGSVVDQAPEKLKFIGVLIGLLIKRYPKLCKPRLVTGALHPAVALRMGIATVDKTEQCNVTIEHKDLGFPSVSPSAARYAQLALPAAAWVILNAYDGYTLGGTRSLESFIKFAVGYAWHQQDADDEAERYYVQARGTDRRNTAAAINLARLWQEREILAGATTPGDSRWKDLLRWVTETTRAKTGDLQWYRSRYLLSLGLADRERPEQGAVDVEEHKQALRFAVDLAIEVMEQLKDPDANVPREFLENSQGPALALAVSQMIPSTETKDEIVTIGFVPDDITGDDVLRELKKARDGGNVAPEILIPFIEACPPDDEVDYNLYRYQLHRQQACEEAIAALEEELEEADEERPVEAVTPDNFYGSDYTEEQTGEEGISRALLRDRASGERERELRDDERLRELRTRLQDARDAARDASTALDRYAERLRRSADPVLQARASALTRAERLYDDSDRSGWQEPFWDRPASQGRHAGEPPSLPTDTVRHYRPDTETGTAAEPAAPETSQPPAIRPDELPRKVPEGRDTDTSASLGRHAGEPPSLPTDTVRHYRPDTETGTAAEPAAPRADQEQPAHPEERPPDVPEDTDTSLGRHAGEPPSLPTDTVRHYRPDTETGIAAEPAAPETSQPPAIRPDEDTDRITNKSIRPLVRDENPESPAPGPSDSPE